MSRFRQKRLVVEVVALYVLKCLPEELDNSESERYPGKDLVGRFKFR